MLKKPCFGVFFVGMFFLFGCATLNNKKSSHNNDPIQADRGLAGEKDASVVESHGDVTLLYIGVSRIFIKQCVKETILKENLYKKRDCHQKAGTEIREISVDEFKEDLKRILRMPETLSKTDFDGNTKKKVALYRRGEQSRVVNLRREKLRIENTIARTNAFKAYYSAKNNSKKKKKQKEQKEREARVKKIESILKESQSLLAVRVEVNNLIDAIVNDVLSHGQLKQFVFFKNQTRFEFNLLKSYLRGSGDLQAYFVPIKAGIFMMGTPEGEYGRSDDETLHEVKTLTKDFEIQATEVTQRQWFRVMGDNPSKFKPSKGTDSTEFTDSTELTDSTAERDYCPETAIIEESYTMCPDHPVEMVSWNDVQSFIRKLNRSSETYSYRLPTEEEWEYVARAGESTPFNLGEKISTDRVNYNGYFPYTNGAIEKYRGQTVAVGSLDNANHWGLFDTHGNVSEWVQDIHGDYPQGSVENSDGASADSNSRVLRGGSWYSGAQYVRSGARDSLDSKHSGSHIGFRLVRTAK